MVKLHCLLIPTGMPIGPVNAYLFEDDPLTIVDLGAWTPTSQNALEKALAGLGYRIRDLRHVVLTHTHSDHHGLTNYVLHQAPEARLFVHPIGATWLLQRDETAAKLTALLEALAQGAGTPAELRRQHQQSTRPYLIYNEPLQGIASERIQLINDGETLRWGGWQWRALHTPGHDAGHLAFYEPTEGLLIGGDLLLADVRSSPLLECGPDEQELPATPGLLRTPSMRQQLTGLARIAALPLTASYSGHGPVIENPAVLAAQRTVEYATRKEKLAALLREHPGQSVHELATRQLTRLDYSQMFPAYMGYSEIIGLLDLLAEEGRLTITIADGVWRYHA